MDDENITIIDDAISDLPEEVTDFVFGEDIQSVIDEIGVLLNGNKEQKEHIYNDITFFLLGMKSIEEVRSYIESLPIGVSIQNQIKVLIKEKIIDDIYLSMEISREDEKLPTQDINTTPVSTAGALEGINKSFTTPTTLAPTKRVYTEPTTTPSTTPPVGNKPLSEAIPVPPVKVDPYREAPDVR